MAIKDNERFVVTGMGLASPIGNHPETAWQTLLAGGHGVENVRETLFAGYNSLPIHVAAPVKNFNLIDEPLFTAYKKEIRSKWDLSQQFALWAGAQALRQAGLISSESLRVEDNNIDPARVGIYVGTGVGGANGLADARVVLEDERVKYEWALLNGDEEAMATIEENSRLNPKSILKSLPGRVAGTPSLVFGAKAFWKGILQECASGNGAIISAIEAIKLGKADMVLAGGVEGDITPATTGLFGSAKAVNRTRDPSVASRPLDQNRDGLVMGQGSGMVVVESMEHAINRGALILAEIVGYAENADAMYETEPDPANVAACLQTATKPLGKVKGAVVNFHATSTGAGDAEEMKAVANSFEPGQLAGISATKSGTGHMFGAAGAAEAVFSILTLRDSKTPPIHNLENPLPEAKGYEHLMSGSEPIEGDVEVVINESFGFGGNNAVTVYTRPR